MYKLILVDDEPWALSRLSKIIDWRQWGMEVINTCSSGEEALEHIMERQPDAVFTDVRMDRMTGIDLMRRTKERYPEIEFVIVSAYSDFEAAREAIIHDACHYLLKPLDRDEVRDAVQRLLTKLKARRSSRPSIDLGRTNDPETRRLLEKVRLYENCYAAVSKKSEFPAKKQPGWICQPVEIAGIPFSALISLEDRIAALSAEPFSSPPSDVGISMVHEDFTAFDRMIHEAQVSLSCAARFAGHPIVSAAQYYLGGNLAAQFTIKELAAQYYISESYFGELFKRFVGISVNQYVKNLRLNKAMELLSGTNDNVKEIAGACGYQDYGYFGKVFKRSCGLTPEQYRKQARKG